MKTFKKDTPVQFVQPPIQGVILSGRLSESGDAVNYTVAFPLPNGEWVEREFDSEALVALEDESAIVVQEKHEEFLELRAFQGDQDEAASRLHDRQTEPAPVDAGQIAAEVSVIHEERAEAQRIEPVQGVA